MKITETEKFRKAFEELTQGIKKKAKKQFQLFLSNLFHPSLHTEKLEPKEKNIWSFRIDKKIRVIFIFTNQNEILLLDIGPHDIYRKRYA